MISSVLERRSATPHFGSKPSKRYPTSSKKRRLSPLFRSSDILLRGFIIPFGTWAVRTNAFPFLLPVREGEPSEVVVVELVGEAILKKGRGSSSELSTPQRERSELYDSRDSKSSFVVRPSAGPDDDSGRVMRKERYFPAYVRVVEVFEGELGENETKVDEAGDEERSGIFGKEEVRSMPESLRAEGE